MITETDAKARPSKIIKMFGARRVFVFYAICLVVTVGTMIASIITSFVPEVNTVEKMLEHVFLCVGGLLLLSIPIIMHGKYDFKMPWYINMTIAFLILAHFVLGEIYLFYENLRYFDKFLHLTGGLVIAACGFSIVYGFNSGGNGKYMKLSPIFAGIFSFCFALALLVLWEIFEYYVDVLGGYNMQRWSNSLFLLTSGETLTVAVDSVKNCFDNRVSFLASGDFLTAEIDGTKYYLNNMRFGHGLVDTMDDLVIGTIGAAVVSIWCALSLTKNPDNKNFLIVRDKSD